MISLLSIWSCFQPEPANLDPVALPAVERIHGYQVPEVDMAPAFNVKITQTSRIPAGNPVRIPAKKIYQELPTASVSYALSYPDSLYHIPGKNRFAAPVVHPVRSDTVLAKLPKTITIDGMTSNDINPACITRFGKLQGLDAYNVMCSIQDRRGNIWLAIWNGGITRYDGHHFYTYTQNEGLKDDKVLSLFEDGKGNIWIGYFDQGISKFDGSSFTHYSAASGFAENSVKSICEDGSGNLWLGSFQSGITTFDGHHFIHFGHAQGFTDAETSTIIRDQDNLWIGTRGGGLFRYDGKGFARIVGPGIPLSNQVNALCKYQTELWIGTRTGLAKLDRNRIQFFTGKALAKMPVQSIEKDDRGNVWIGTYLDGIYRYNGTKLYQYTEADGLGNRSVQTILKDHSGNIWFGTKAGFELFHGDLFSHWTANEGLLQNDVIAIEQGKQQMWFGTEDGFTGYDGQFFEQYGTMTGLPNRIVFSILEDSRGNIWLGTNTGPVLFDGNEYITFPQMEQSPVLNIMEDRSGNIWLGGEGVTKFTYGVGNQNTFTHYGEKQGLSNKEVKCIAEDSSGNYWIGTDSGLNRFNPNNGQFTHYSREQGLTNTYITSLYVNEKNQLWIGTFGGGMLKYQYDQTTGAEYISSYRETNGLISDWVSSILEDKEGNLWVGGRHGICKVSFSSPHGALPEKIHFRNYRYINGFLGGSCNMRATSLGTDGDLWVGTKTMATTIHPAGEKIDTQPPLIEIVNVKLFGEEIHWRQMFTHPDQAILLANGIRLDKETLEGVKPWLNVPEHLSLKYNHNDLNIVYTNVTTLQNDQILYQHKLEGLDINWSFLSPIKEVHFGPLPPGHYTFKLRAVNVEGKWSPEVKWPFIIRPPWWKTWWAYLIYLGIFLLLGYSILQYELKRQQLQHSLEMEALESQNLKELDLIKTKLYTNITHEFRTPLTVILGITDQIRASLAPGLQDKMETIRRNGWQLLNLVNQMLDLAKIESHQMGLQLIQGDVTGYLRYLTKSFSSLAHSKGIDLEFSSSTGEVLMDYDPGKLLQIVSNLISNAVKFTPQGGRINLDVSTVDPVMDPDSDNPGLKIEVSDTGIGIPNDHLPFIFNRFYQSENAKSGQSEGTGIGLTLTQELVHLMNGTISVSSTPGIGSNFRIILPIRNSAPMETSDAPMDVLKNVHASLPGTDYKMQSTQSGEVEKPLLLIIEDNEDIQAYLVSCLNEHYALEIATDGAMGIETALRIIPDVIITDVMMPIKDGYEVTGTLKTNMATSHIPIIILTAKITAEDRIAGLKRGADVYLGKPFYQEELLLNVQNLIKIREQLQERYRTLESPLSRQMPTSEPEDEFILKLRNVIELQLDQADLSIEDICKLMAMSRMQLHRKVKALTNLSTSIYIRNIRLMNAKMLLESTGMNVSEVAYAVGFEDPRYFSRVFSDHFGFAPSELK
ncbi:MAG: helix-turn-helix domain-containing protein [Saprospiraceae bacterium]|nr:helix-turn-helix domain-containing protein [Saprospiraceae bacterium]